MIEEPEAKQLFLRACPSFDAHFREMEAEWSPDALSLFNILFELAPHLVEELEKNNTDELKACLGVVEDILESGTEGAKDAATVGFLEDLQNYAKGKGIMPEVFVPFLGHKTKGWWNDLSKNWAGQTDW